MAEPTHLAPAPLTAPLTDREGRMTAEWQRFFMQLFSVSGNVGTAVTSNTANIASALASLLILAAQIAALQASAVPATLVSLGLIELAGDLAGTATAPHVVGLRGIPLNAIAPTDGQVPTYVAAHGDLEYQSPIAPAPTTHTEVLVDGNGALVFANGDLVYIPGVAN